ncbi:lysoplasmalogenase [Pleionea sediminis]|uniref:lysoplasmalogenase n=1 Tax=Pleionea sediminis TaxID=2569479 RepID=UPI0011872286|nr:lysoplasmalogenase [Pleionea sediminis]
MYFILLASASLLTLLCCDFFNKKTIAAACKLITSLSLVGYTISNVLTQNNFYSYCILIAILICVIGDLLLISQNKNRLAAGIIAFFLGHVFFIVAFFQLPFQYTEWLVSFGIMLVIGYQVYQWLKPNLTSSRLKLFVPIYMIILFAMTSLGLSIKIENEPTLVGLGATLFMVSDLFVAYNRFKKPQFHNRLIGLPLYYLGQFILATTVLHLQTNTYWLPV